MTKTLAQFFDTFYNITHDERVELIHHLAFVRMRKTQELVDTFLPEYEAERAKRDALRGDGT